MPLVTEIKQDCPECGSYQVRLIAYKHDLLKCIDCYTKQLLKEYGDPKKVACKLNLYGTKEVQLRIIKNQKTQIEDLKNKIRKFEEEVKVLLKIK